MVDLKTILENYEGINLEAKSAQKGIPSSVWETYSSFANSFGGTIVLGVGEDKATRKFVPLGVPDAEGVITDIWNTLNNKSKISANILLKRHVYKCELDGREYVVIEVPRANRKDKPVFINDDMFGGSYKRNHAVDYNCTRDEVIAMLRDQSDTSADSRVVDGLGIESLNGDSVRSYRSRFASLHGSHVWNGLPDDEFLMKIGAVRIAESDGKVHPTLAGLLFFGEFVDISNELPNFFLDYRESLPGDTRWADRVCSGDADWTGNVYDFYFKVARRLTADLKRPFALDGNLQRVDDTPIHRSLRECLANALIHADYYGRRGVVIEKKPGQMVFSNPGTFRIDVQEAIAGGVSDARNARIFNMFSLINVGERSGTGICDVFSTWKANGLTKPRITETLDPDRVSFVLEGDFSRLGQDEGAGESTEQRILKILADSPELTLKEISLRLPLPLPNVKYYMRKLQDDGSIVRVGSKYQGRWQVKSAKKPKKS